MGSIADIAAALAAIPDDALRVLKGTLDREPVIVPGLSAWLTRAADWEASRRSGSRDELRGPRDAIDEGELECSLVALAMLHAAVRTVAGAADFLDATAAALCARPRGPAEGVH